MEDMLKWLVGGMAALIGGPMAWMAARIAGNDRKIERLKDRVYADFATKAEVDKNFKLLHDDMQYIRNKLDKLV